MSKNQIQVFNNDEFGEIRTVEIDGQPWFIGKDVATILGYSNTSKAIQVHVDDDDKLTSHFGMSGQNRKMTIINESGLYSLILSSKLPSAKAFKRWVTSEVLPCIRKHGGYIVDELLEKLAESESERNAFMETLLKEQKAHTKDLKKLKKAYEALIEAEVDKELLEIYVEIIEPKAEYCDIIFQCENSIPISVIAKDYGMTAAKLNKLLHKNGIQFKVGGTWVLYKKYCNCGYTESKTYYIGDGECHVHTYWTQSGRRLIYDTLKSLGFLPECER